MTFYHPLVPTRVTLAIDTSLLPPGLCVAIALSGGADSVALLRVLAERSGDLGLVLHACHLHHGLRGAEADADLEFCRELCDRLAIPFHQARADIAAEARPSAEKPGETIEEAARRVRYAWFRQLLQQSPPPAVVATAHTLDDQAETVLAKFLRGAWTEGLGGIAPVLEFPQGKIVRPLLGVTRAEIERYLQTLQQPWREDSTNRHLTFTRNRIRHELLPQLEGWNPRLREHLTQMAILARDDEAWWDAEVARLAPQLILPGKPVRGGGRAADPGLAIDLTRFAQLHPALQRRLLRHAAGRLGAQPNFTATEALRELILSGRAGQKCEIENLHAERTSREIHLDPGAPLRSPLRASSYSIPVPGQIDAPAFGLRLRIETTESVPEGRIAILRPWSPGDRVRLRYSSSPRKVKDILGRMHVSGSQRGLWPVLEFDGRVVWMKGVSLEPEPGLTVHADTIDDEMLPRRPSDSIPG